jgi:hypothetical protein
MMTVPVDGDLLRPLSLKNGIVVALLIHFSCVNTFVPHPLVSAGGCLLPVNKIHQSTQHPQNNFFLQTNPPPKPKGKREERSQVEEN